MFFRSFFLHLVEQRDGIFHFLFLLSLVHGFGGKPLKVALLGIQGPCTLRILNFLCNPQDVWQSMTFFVKNIILGILMLFAQILVIYIFLINVFQNLSLQNFIFANFAPILFCKIFGFQFIFQLIF